MRRFRRNNYKFVPDRVANQDNTLDFEISHSKDIKPEDKSAWNIPIERSNLGKRDKQDE